MILLVDIGNTRLKWAVSEGTQLSPQQAIVRSEVGYDEQAAIMLQSGAPARILLSNVAGSAVERELTRALRQRTSAPIEFVRSTASECGITNAYPQPERLGTDRWMSVIAAHHLVGAACIATFGTAMTIDAVTADGRHLGGVIVPGPQLMIDSLLSNTSDLAARSRDGDVTDALFADNTRGAIHQGAWYACAALVERAYSMSAQQMKAQPTLILSGGAGEQVAKLLTIPLRFVSDLVLRGLVLVAAHSS
jgi:type III pantothenate kinase